MKSTLQKGQTDFSNQLWATYSWFSDEFTPRVELACSEFFGLELGLKLFAVSENDNVFFRGDEYFVTRIKVKKNLDVIARLSKDAVGSILDETLGKSGRPFIMEQLSELEAKIITSFNDFLFNNIKKTFVPLEEIDKNEMPTSVCNLVYYIKFKNKNFGKLVVSVPTNLLKPIAIENTEETFSIGNFKKSKTELKIKVGSSKLTLGEVKGLQKDDILLLENSNIYTMTICKGAQEINFKISPDPSIILNTDEEGDTMTENTTAGNNIWDSIQVDINAEFEKVKISLGELKQISEGLVVDIGSIYDNKIDLKVENKIVAKGELVIINDRYGVRIDEVVQEPEEEETPVYQEQQNIPEETNEESFEEEDFDDEDFDYDDFEEDNEI